MTFRPPLRVAGIAVATVALVVAGGCSSPDPAATPAEPGTVASTGRTAPGASLPPDDAAELAEIFQPLLTPLGLRFTRGSVVARGGDTPNHLALYAEPTATWEDERFVTTIVPLARAVTPVVFATWSGLDSYDICQEPSPAIDDSPEASPITQLDMERSYAESVDWDTVTLGRIVRDLPTRTDVFLYTTGDLAPAVRQAAAAG